VLVTLARRTRKKDGGSDLPARDAAVKPTTAEEAAKPESTTPTVFVSGNDLGLTQAERNALQAGAGMPPGQSADFTRLKGIGPTFDQRLKEAGITTFAALAGLTPEAISAIIGWPPERIVRDELREQATALAMRE